MDTSLIVHNTSTKICAYEEERNSRIQALHDAVQRDLCAKGFLDVVPLRSAFSREASNSVGVDDAPSSRKTRRKRFSALDGEVTLRRSSRQRQLVEQQTHAVGGDNCTRKKVQEPFCTWPGKNSKKEIVPQMSKNKVTSKRKLSESPDPAMETDQEDSEGKSPSPELGRIKLASASEERRPTIFEDDIQDSQVTSHPREVDGAPRPPRGGYHVQEYGRRAGPEWGEDYPLRYAQGPGGSFRGSVRRPVSASPFIGGRDYDGRGAEYSGRMLHYDGRSDFPERRDPYYGGRGMDFNRQDREYEEQRRFEESRYDRQHYSDVDMYVNVLEKAPAEQYARSIRPNTSPPPSSSAIVVNKGKGEVSLRRPIRLDHSGFPTGKMAGLLHADIVSYVKDMDPNGGWEAQTKEDKDRVRDRVVHDYEIYGDSTVLSEKYLRKTAGSALTQFRYNLNQSIDKGCKKPGDLKKEYWDALVEKRGSEEGKAKSERMASISRGRSSRHTTKKAVEDSVLVSLTRELKREPYESETKEAVQKEMAIINDLAAEKKRLRAVTKASNTATAATAALEKRLEIVEAFMRKWEPDFTVWKSTQPEVEVLDFAQVKTNGKSTTEEVALLSVTNEGQQDKADEDDKIDLSTDDGESSDKSKSTDDENTKLTEEVSESDVEKMEQKSIKAVRIVEPEEIDLKEGSQKKSEFIRTVPFQKSNVVIKVAATDIAETESLGGQSCSQQKKGDVRQTGHGLVTKEKDNGSIADKGKEKESRPGKRQKVDSKTGPELQGLDNEKAANITIKDCRGKSSKSIRKNAKNSQAKEERARKKAK